MGHLGAGSGTWAATTASPTTENGRADVRPRLRSSAVRRALRGGAVLCAPCRVRHLIGRLGRDSLKSQAWLPRGLPFAQQAKSRAPSCDGSRMNGARNGRAGREAGRAGAFLFSRCQVAALPRCPATLCPAAPCTPPEPDGSRLVNSGRMAKTTARGQRPATPRHADDNDSPSTAGGVQRPLLAAPAAYIAGHGRPHPDSYSRAPPCDGAA